MTSRSLAAAIAAVTLFDAAAPGFDVSAQEHGAGDRGGDHGDNVQHRGDGGRHAPGAAEAVIRAGTAAGGTTMANGDGAAATATTATG